jgi:WD40 repeat protein
MKALEPHVLQTALEIQDELLGSTVNFNPRIAARQQDEEGLDRWYQRDSQHVINGLTNQSWFYQSPLQYWACTSEEIAQDQDIVRTVNERSHHGTSVNITLRPSIVFSGKRFENHKLVAADALVITLVHMLDSPVGREWERRAQALANGAGAGKWTMYPSTGLVQHSQLFEFRFQPLSRSDDLILGITYTVMVLYFLLSLTKLRALKSRFGLIIAVITQIAISIMSSFTICAIFKIDLSKIPREAYPVVVLTIGLESMFRLINAVIVTHSENSTVSRISEALGNVGHIALASVSQNLIILWVLSKMVSPGVAAFCTFAAIALTFDFFYLITFFTAVLSVEVRRTELQESLSRATKRRAQNMTPAPQSPDRNSWKDAILRGDAPTSTRIAGTAVMISFILGAQRHFFDGEHPVSTMGRFTSLFKSANIAVTESSILHPSVNQARSPTAWLRLQDHETAREVINVIKPSAHSYIAQVYDPIVFVVNGSDRTPSRQGVRLFLPAAYDFINHQSAFFILVIVFVVAIVCLLMNYLLWNEVADEEDAHPHDQPALAVKTLRAVHALDIVMFTASPIGRIASVGLDRRICIWDALEDARSYAISSREGNEHELFPVAALALDTSSEWLAVLSSSGRVSLWNIPERRWVQSMEVSFKEKRPAAFFFEPPGTDIIPNLIVVQHNGHMADINLNTTVVTQVRICRSPLVTVLPLRSRISSPSQLTPRVITSSRHSCVHIASEKNSEWVSNGFHLSKTESNEDFTSVFPLPTIDAFLAVAERRVDLIDLESHVVLQSFVTKHMKPHSLRALISIRRSPTCSLTGLARFSLVYSTLDTDECVLQHYTPSNGREIISIRNEADSGDRSCCPWDEATVEVHVVPQPGTWETMDVGYVVGVRKKLSKIPSAKFSPMPSMGLRRRKYSNNVNNGVDEDDDWEAWMLSTRGETSTTPLNPPDTNGHMRPSNLLVTSIGPATKIGSRSIAVGFGNVVKVLTVGNERFDDEGEAEGGMTFASVGRRKRALAKKRSLFE